MIDSATSGLGVLCGERIMIDADELSRSIYSLEFLLNWLKKKKKNKDTMKFDGKWIELEKR